jgi:predicted RNA binding protein YcfA (HicA-like mRNA interferase family)
VIQLFLPHTPQPCAKVRKAVERLGFVKTSQTGSHEQYEKVENGIKRKVTVDCHNGEVGAKVIKSIVSQCGVSKLQFLQALNGK